MRCRWLAVLGVFVTALTACTTEAAGPTTPPEVAPVTLTVLAASSLSNVFPRIGELFTASHPNIRFRFSFAGTDALTAQIEQGAPADVFAGASTKYGDQLAAEHLIDPPKVFATNTLVLIVASANPAHIRTLADLTKPLKLVIGAEAVPVGAYTRKVLANLDAVYGPTFDKKVLANVVSNEDSVAGVLSKVRLGEADAGFVYVTDAVGAQDQVTSIALPATAQAVASYPIAAVAASKRSADARSFVAFVMTGPPQAVLKGASFGPPA
jgi:molybdate transport system substrate-binding protein